MTSLWHLSGLRFGRSSSPIIGQWMSAFITSNTKSTLFVTGQWMNEVYSCLRVRYSGSVALWIQSHFIGHCSYFWLYECKGVKLAKIHIWPIVVTTYIYAGRSLLSVLFLTSINEQRHGFNRAQLCETYSKEIEILCDCGFENTKAIYVGLWKH